MCEKQVISTFTVAEMARFCVFPYKNLWKIQFSVKKIKKWHLMYQNSS